MNTEEEDGGWKRAIIPGMGEEQLAIVNSKNFGQELSLQPRIDQEETQKVDMGNDTEKEILNTINMSQEVQALSLTLKRQELGNEDDFKAAVLSQIRNLNFEPYRLTNWATGMLHFIAAYSNAERGELQDINPAIAEWARPSQATISGPFGERENTRAMGPMLGKRPPPTWLTGSSRDVEKRPIELITELERNNLIFEEEITPTRSCEFFQSSTFPNSLVFHRGTGEGNQQRFGQRSWKRDARRRNPRREVRSVGEDRADGRIFEEGKTFDYSRDFQ